MTRGKVFFTLEKVADPNTGVEVDTLFKNTEIFDRGPTDPEKEAWCNVLELDQLFNACVSKWGDNWDLAKVIVAIQDSEIR